MDFIEENKKFIVGVVIILIILFIVYIFVSNSSKRINKSFSSSKIKDSLIESTRKYCDDRCDNLFQDDAVVSITPSTLERGGYLESFDDLVGKKYSCDADIVISKGYDGYNFIPVLDCGDDYSDVTLLDQINVDNSVVLSGDGLYSNDSYMYFRGENVNNYIKLGEFMFRILKFNDNSVTLVLEDSVYSLNHVWDDRYNSDIMKNHGINDFSVSRAKDSLISFLNKKLSVLSNKVIVSDYCVGSRDSFSTEIDSECSDTSRSFVSLLTVSDYMMASLDENCISIDVSKACQNYNYLRKYKDSFWLLTPVLNSTTDVYSINRGVIRVTQANDRHSLRAVFTISGSELYKSGDGTLANPYIIYGAEPPVKKK